MKQMEAQNTICYSLQIQLKHQHEGIEPLISKLDAGQLKLRPTPEKWSILDNIAHLTVYQFEFIRRIKLIVDSDEPILERYRAEDDPQFESWRLKSTEQLITQLNHDREMIVRTISQLSASDLAKKGTHPRYGKMTVVEWIEFFILHEAHHMFTIFQLVYQ